MSIRIHGRCIAEYWRALLRLAPGFALLLLFWSAGELISRRVGLPVPGSVLGMALLAAALRLRVVPLRMVEPAAALLIRRMALFFVPPGVAILLYLDVLRSEWLALLLATVVGTVGVLLTVGLLQKRLDGHD
ncbi:MAG: CidA/LrgA family protein [Gemmatimonadota bacterium]